LTLFATTSSGTRIAYATAGRPWRPALIFTHSLGSDHRMWESQIQTLKSQYFVAAIDNVGHGESDVPPGDYSVVDFADAVLAVAAAAELEHFHYCGLSVGGLTGLWLGVHHADRLLSLTLSNTSAKIGTSELWDERITIARTQGMGALVDGVIARWFSADFANDHPEQFARARAQVRHALHGRRPGADHPDALALQGGEALGFEHIDAEHHGINRRGRCRGLRDAQRGRHGTRLVELEAAHLSNLDREPEFTEALDRFLGETTH